MKQFAALALSALLLATPAQAQDQDKDTMSDGLTLLEDGARLLLRGLAEEMKPALRDLAENMEPAMRKLLEIVDDFDAYHLPEVLPNGDIIIRRKAPRPPMPTPLTPEPPAPGEEVEI